MKDLSKFGTDEHPVHPSGMRNIVLCPWRAVVDFLEAPEGVPGQAADTGSAVHAAAAALHRGASVASALEEMGDRRAEFPIADLTEAAALFLAYTRDPRNIGADVVLVEQPIAFSIQAAAHDPTGAPVQVIGKLDQVRRVDGGALRMFDIKTSKRDPTDLLLEHAMQAAAYCVGASMLLKARVEPGALILPRRYKPDGTGPAFRYFAWTLDDADSILEPLRNAVANIRAGRVHHVAGDWCAWCSQRTPDLCVPKLRNALRSASI